uniref:Uncharacterized protein n=1 Tax=Nonomuraea gerenzanensis TaxID=93944 RepID=A0A1M4EGB2_9ACTN|nr:hypothetical protein BN4615_P7523 [Nonomuraea gerenzanensis]
MTGIAMVRRSPSLFIAMVGFPVAVHRHGEGPRGRLRGAVRV